MQSFSDWLAERLRERDWSSADLGRASGVDKTNITRWISERRRPTPANLKRIAPSLGVSYEELMRRCDYLPGEADDTQTELARARHENQQLKGVLKELRKMLEPLTLGQHAPNAATIGAA